MFFTREDILKIQNALLQLGVKDSELPNAEPVNYNDILSIVQDGKNKHIKIKDFFNQISLWKKEDFINITDKYDKYNISLLEAINLVSTLQRKNGLVITFQDIEGNWRIYQFRGDITEFFEENKWFDLYDYRNNIIQSIVPDEEDLTASTPDENGNSLVSLKDRVYDPTNFSGKGYKILRRNIQSVKVVSTKIIITEVPSSDGILFFTINRKETQVVVSATTDNTTELVAQKVAIALQDSMTEYDVSIDASLITLIRKSSNFVTPSVFSASTTGVVCTITDSTKREVRNILMSNMINQPNIIYEIRYNFDLDGRTITIPNNCILYFTSGKFYNGNINMDNTIVFTLSKEVLSEVNIRGNYYNIEKDIEDAKSLFQINLNKLNAKHESLSKTVHSIAVTGEASTATNVTYDNDTSGLNAENTQDAIDEIATAITDETTRAKTAEKAILFDVSVHNNGIVFESLLALLSASNLSTLIPTEVRCGGMTIRFIQSSDHKYVQYRLKTDSWSTNPNFWERYNDVTTDNQTDSDLDFSDEQGNILARFSEGHIKTKYFDSSKDVSGVVTENTNNADLDFSDEQGNVVMRIANGHIKTKNFDSENIQSSSSQSVSKPKISYLAIGNSVNQDVVAYIPYLLKTLYGNNIDFEIGIAFIGSYTIKDYVEQVITKQKKIEVYSYANNTDIWTNYNNTYYLEDILGLHKWNIISFQMYQTRTIVSAHIEDVTLAPQLLNYIKSKAIQDCVFGFVTPATYTDMRSTYIEWQQTVLTNCALDFFIDYGATKELMIGKGISSSLMTTDGYHSNEGFPCISLSLTAIHVLAKLINIKDKSSNLKDRMTVAKHSTLNIPNQNGVFTTTTEDNWIIGIDSAINGFRVSNATLNISNNTLRQQTYNN